MAKQTTPSSRTSAAQQLWDEVTAEYDLEKHELVLLDQACQVMRLIEQLEQAVAKHGAMVVNSQGNRHVHPAIRELRGQRSILSVLIRQLGLGDDGRVAERHRKPRVYGLRAV